MLIRSERPDDFDAIRDVVAAAFERPDEAELVQRLRESDAYVPDLALVAEADGEIVGHVMLTYARVGDHRILSLAPLAVRPDVQRSGIGIALTRAALDAADQREEPLVVVLGHPTYYPRFGFEAARPLGIEPTDDATPDEAFMVVRLGHFKTAIKGRIEYPDAFNA